MRMKISPGGGPGTAAQIEARERNFRIWRLRGHFQQSYMILGPRGDMIRQLIDEEITQLGAESQLARIKEYKLTAALYDLAPSKGQLTG